MVGEWTSLRAAIVRAVNTIIPCDLRKTQFQRDLAEMSPPDRISVFLLKESKGKEGQTVRELELLYGAGGASPEGYPRGESPWAAQYVMKTGMPLLVPDTRLEAELEKPPGEPNWFKVAQQELISTGFMTHSAVAVPITDGEGKFMGVLQAMNTLHEGQHFLPGLRMPDMANLIKLVPCIAAKIAQLRGEVCGSYIGDGGWSGLTMEQILASEEGTLDATLID